MQTGKKDCFVEEISTGLKHFIGNVVKLERSFERFETELAGDGEDSSQVSATCLEI